jgi:hypothetical protein
MDIQAGNPIDEQCLSRSESAFSQTSLFCVAVKRVENGNLRLAIGYILTFEFSTISTYTFLDYFQVWMRLSNCRVSSLIIFIRHEQIMFGPRMGAADQ